MLHSKKGYIFYELMLCFVILTTLIYSFLVPLNQLIMQLENHKLSYKMKQTLTLNVVLVESGKPFTTSEDYEIILENNTLCIYWWDIKNERKTVCEKVWL